MKARGLLGRLALVLPLMLACTGAQAHTRSESQSHWVVKGTTAEGVVLVAEAEAQQMAVAQGLASVPAVDAAMVRYVEQQVQALAGTEPCAPAVPARALPSSNGWHRVALELRCPQAPTELRWNGFFDTVAAHRHLIHVQTAEGQASEQLLDSEHRSASLTQEASLQGAVFLDFLLLGMEHIFTGPDHQAFLLGLVLLSRRLRDLVFVITGFTLGHSLTLGLAVLGWLRPATALNDALVGVTIALIGAEIAAQRLGAPRRVALAAAGLLLVLAFAGRWLPVAPPWLLLAGLALFSACYLLLAPQIAEAARLRLVVTLVFGLVHGFTFAASLVSLGLPQGRIGELLLGFNLGVELAQLLLVSAVWLLAMAAARLGAARWRPLLEDGGAAALAGLGLFWFVSRAYA